MKKQIIFTTLFFSLFLITCTYGQDTITNGMLTVWSEQGWIIKAKNIDSMPVKFKFSWTTQGTNSNGEIVYSVTEESQLITLNPNELRHFFTAPQDPNKQITYVFIDIKITEYDPVTMEDLMEEKRKAKIESGQ